MFYLFYDFQTYQYMHFLRNEYTHIEGHAKNYPYFTSELYNQKHFDIVKLVFKGWYFE